MEKGNKFVIPIELESLVKKKSIKVIYDIGMINNGEEGDYVICFNDNTFKIFHSVNFRGAIELA